MINPWIQGRVPGVRPFPPLGAWMVKRNLASAPYVPPQWVRMALTGARKYWMQFPALALAKAQTQLTRVKVNEDFWVLAIMGTQTSGLGGSSGTFRAQIYEAESRFYYSEFALNQKNIAASSKEPLLLPIPHFIEKGTLVNCRIQNLDQNNPNTVSICMFGYSA